LVGHASGGLLALAVQPEALHLDGGVGVAGALEGVVIEVVLARAHGAERESQARFARGHQPLDVVAECDGAAGLQVELAERASCTLGAGLEVVEARAARALRDRSGCPDAVSPMT